MAAEKTFAKRATLKAVPFENFKKGIARAGLASACVPAGPEEMRRREVIKLIIARAEKTGGPPSLMETLCPQNTGEISALPVAEIFDHLRSRSLFGGLNLVVMRMADFFLSAAGNLEHILNYMKSPAGNSCLVIEMAKSDAKSSIAKKLGKFATVVDCRSLYDRPAPWQTGMPQSESELTGWIVAQARERFGKKMSKEAAYELAQMCGSSLSRLKNEMEKLSLFIGEEKAVIEIEDIEKSAGHIRTHGLFSLMDAVADRRTALALETLRAMFDRGLALGADEPVTDSRGIAIILVSRLHRRLKQLAKARQMMDSDADVDEFRKAFKFRMEFQARRLAQQAANFSADDFPPRFLAILRADETLKTTSIPPDIVLPQLIVQLTK